METIVVLEHRRTLSGLFDGAASEDADFGRGGGTVDNNKLLLSVRISWETGNGAS